MIYRLFSDRVGIRTPNLLIRSEVLYPVELHSRFPNVAGGKDTNSIQSTKWNEGIIERNSFQDDCTLKTQRPMALLSVFDKPSSCNIIPMV